MRISNAQLLLAAIVIVAFMLAMNAASRAQPAPASPQIQALSNKLIQEIDSSLKCSENAITLQQQLATAQAEIKRLSEPKEDKK